MGKDQLMSFKVLQVIPKLGYGGAETGCYDLAHYLSEKNCKSLLIPAGFAHGFLTLDKENIVFYGNDNYRSTNNEVTISWDDPSVNIKWPSGKKIISNKDKSGISFKEFVKKI